MNFATQKILFTDGPADNTESFLREMSVVFQFEKTWRCAVRLPPLGVPAHAAPPIHVSYHVSYHVPMMTYARLSFLLTFSWTGLGT